MQKRMEPRQPLSTYPPAPSHWPLSRVLSLPKCPGKGKLHRVVPGPSQALRGCRGRKAGRRRGQTLQGPGTLGTPEFAHTTPCPLRLGSPPHAGRGPLAVAQGPPGPGAPHPLRCCRPSCPLHAQSQAVRPSASPGPAPPPPGQQAAAPLQCPELPQQQWSHPQKQCSRGTERGGRRATGTPPPNQGPLSYTPAWSPWACCSGGTGVLWEIWGNWVCRENKER